MMVKIRIEKNDSDQRLDRFLKKYYGKATLGHIYKMIRKDIKINGKRGDIGTMLREGDLLTVYLTEEESDALRQVKKVYRVRKQFQVAYEDDRVLIVDKPFGLLTHGDAREKKNTLANQVAGYLLGKGEYLPGREQTFMPAPVNRLDRNTTGLVVFGKDAAKVKELNRIFRERDKVEKYYRTIVWGRLNGPLELRDRMEKDQEVNKVKIAAEGKDMVTQVTPLDVRDGYSFVEAKLLTGRTHQIRVHLQAAGYPLIGDGKYGDPRVNAKVREKFDLTTQILHGCRLIFREGSLAGKDISSSLPGRFEEIREEIFGGNGEKGRKR